MLVESEVSPFEKYKSLGGILDKEEYQKIRNYDGKIKEIYEGLASIVVGVFSYKTKEVLEIDREELYSLEDLLKKYFSVKRKLKRKEETKTTKEVGREIDIFYYIKEAYAILGNEEKIKELKKLKQIF